MDDETDHPARSGKVRLKSTRSRSTPYNRPNRKYLNKKEENKEKVSYLFCIFCHDTIPKIASLFS